MRIYLPFNSFPLRQLFCFVQPRLRALGSNQTKIMINSFGDAQFIVIKNINLVPLPLDLNAIQLGSIAN